MRFWMWPLWAGLAVACGDAAPDDSDVDDSDVDDTDPDTDDTDDTDAGDTDDTDPDTDDTGSDDAEVRFEELVTFQVRGGAGFEDVAPGGMTFGDGRGDGVLVQLGRGEHRARTPAGAVPMPEGTWAWVGADGRVVSVPALGLQEWAADDGAFSALYDTSATVDFGEVRGKISWLASCVTSASLEGPGVIALDIVRPSADVVCEAVLEREGAEDVRAPLEAGRRFLDARNLLIQVSDAVGAGSKLVASGSARVVWTENPATAGGRSYTLSTWSLRGIEALRTLTLEPIGDCASLEVHDLSVTSAGDIYLVGSFCGRLRGLGSSAGAALEATSDELLLVSLDSEGNQRFGRKGGGMSVERVAGVGRGSGKVSLQSFSIGDLPDFAPSCAETVETKAGLWMLDLNKVPAEGPIPVTCVGPLKGTVIAGQYFTAEPLPYVGENAVLLRSETRAQVVDTDGKTVAVYAAWDLDGGVRFDTPSAALVDGEVELPVCVAPGSELREGSEPPGPVLNNAAAACGRSRARVARNAR